MSIKGFKVNNNTEKYDYEALDNLPELEAPIAPSYTEKTYNIGDYVWHNGVLYRCISDITTAEAWTAAHWTVAVLGDDIGDLKSVITFYTGGSEFTDFISGGYIATNGETIDPTDVTANNGWVYAVIDCTEGDVFYLTGRGGNTAKAYAIIDSSNNPLFLASGSNYSNHRTVIPANGAKIIFNFNKAVDYCVYQGEKIKSGFDEADRKTEILENVAGVEIVAPTIAGVALRNSGSTIDLTDYRYAEIYETAILDVSEGDTFNVTASGDGTSYPWAFVDSSGNVLKRSSTVSCVAKDIIAPESAAKVVFCYKTTEAHKIYKGLSVDQKAELLNRQYSEEYIGDIATNDSDVTITTESGTFSATRGHEIGFISNDYWDRSVCDVTPGKRYHIITQNYKGSSIFYAFVDSDDIVLLVGNDTVPNGERFETHVTAPDDAARLWVKCLKYYTSYIGEVVSNKTLQDQINACGVNNNSPFYATYECVEVPAGIGESKHGRLSLIATKKDNYWSKRTGNDVIENPQDTGYLYLDESTDKLYYSSGVYNRPEYLCDWDASIVNNKPCKDYVPIITPDGDILFVVQGKSGRGKPVFYPHGDYSNPSVINITTDPLPGGLTTDTGACVYTAGDFILWGEYQANNKTEYNGLPMRIWKVEKPYDDPASWSVVLTKYYSASGSQWGEDPNNEITHFHTVALDQYTGYFYANTGDADNECRVFESRDLGETWTELVNNDQKWRTLGYIFTEDACYWGTDSYFPNHNIYKVSRDEYGVLDFSTVQKLAICFYTLDSSQHQRVYNTCLTRNPDGLLILDRAEERSDKNYDLQFYSFEKNRLYIIDRLKSSEESDTRYGFGNLACTYYQSTQEDGIICGGNSYDRDMSLDILNNNPSNRLGNTKIVVHRNTPRG